MFIYDLFYWLFDKIKKMMKNTKDYYLVVCSC